MKAGFLQMEPHLGESPHNAIKVGELIEKASEFDLLVLPELANSGYNFIDKDHARSLGEDIDRSHFVDILRKTCALRKCHIVTGFCELEDGILYNSALLINKDGIISKYRKIHLFNNEKDYFTPGKCQPEIFRINEWHVGMLICFDWAFPEIWRILALKRADIVAHPANLCVPGGGHNAVPVHAKINCFHVVTANRIGTERDLNFTGESIIANAHGHVVARAGKDTEEIQIVDLELGMARNKMITPKNDLLKDRRPELYDGLLD